MPGTLYVVATPIGNLQDISLRAKQVLESVDTIVCEDTRVTAKLLAFLEIHKPLKSWRQRSDDKVMEEVINLLVQGQNLAYVSDAGTPGVNDPGGKLSALAQDRGIQVVPVPGASAITAAISVCGFPMENFVYLGFPPHKKGRETFFKDLCSREEAVIFFESTHRLQKALEALVKLLDAGRPIFVGRELTKMHETLYRGEPSQVLQQILQTSIKGEAVIVVAPKKFTS